MKVILTRHGATAGNALKHYCGAGTNEPLSLDGKEALLRAGARDFQGFVYTSGLLRTEQTAQILYPKAQTIAVPDLREMEFGDFEGKNYLDLADDVRYRMWVDGGCLGCCPQGEDREGFVRRSCEAFSEVVEKETQKGSTEAHFVVHGGTIMALVSRLSEPCIEYFSAVTVPGGCWIAEWDGSRLQNARAIESGTV